MSARHIQKIVPRSKEEQGHRSIQIQPCPRHVLVQPVPRGPFPLTELPKELILHIFKFLNKRDLTILERVSKDVKELVLDDSLWKPRVLKQWPEFNQGEAVVPWKQVYVSYYEGPKKSLALTCTSQDIYGHQEIIPFGVRTRIRHLKSKIRKHYHLAPEQSIAIMIQARVLMDEEYVISVIPKRSIVNFILEAEAQPSPSAQSGMPISPARESFMIQNAVS